MHRRRNHLRDPVRKEAGLPVGRSKRGSVAVDDGDPNALKDREPASK
jgi:hypothetical protein